jgi:acetylornithine deacetylase
VLDHVKLNAQPGHKSDGKILSLDISHLSRQPNVRTELLNILQPQTSSACRLRLGSFLQKWLRSFICRSEPAQWCADWVRFAKCGSVFHSYPARTGFASCSSSGAVRSPHSAMLSFRTGFPALCHPYGSSVMNLFEFTRKLIDIESVTPNEHEVGDYLWTHLSDLATRFDGQIERMPVEPQRDNIFVRFGEPVVVLSTHMDTVPPFIPSREEDTHIWGRGACDTKGIIAAMITAVTELLGEGKRNFGLLFVVGEERNSAGARVAAQNPRGSKFLINGEPTESKLALGSKGTLRYEIVASGRMAHSAYPELGESAIEKLLEALNRIRQIKLPNDSLFGPSTLNIGTIQGGRAPNVIPDSARAEILVRVVGDVTDLRTQIERAAKPEAEANEVLLIPALQLGSLDGFPTTVVAFTTDIPAFNGKWGQPFLIGPGSIHVAHTADERISKAELTASVGLYKQLAERLSH